MTEVECGLTCLTMILNYHGSRVSLSELRKRTGVGRDGLSALGIAEVARREGMRVRAVSLQRNDFRFVKLPAIIHWEFDHFLILERWTRRSVGVVDPAMGRRCLTHDEFDDGFTGVLLVLEPGPAFNRRAEASGNSFLSYVLQYVRRAPGTFAQILGVSLLLLLLGLTLPVVTKVVVDQILPFNMQNLMPALAIGMGALWLSQAVATLLREWLIVRLRARIDLHQMLGYVERLFSLPYSYFEQRSTGDLLARVSSNEALREILSNRLISTVMDSSLVVFYLVILLSQSLAFGLLTLGVGLLEVVLLLVTNRPIGRLARRELAAFGKSQGRLGESLVGIVTLKASGAEERALDHWSNAFFDHLNIATRYNYVSGTTSAFLITVPALGQLALLWVGAMQVLNGSISLGTMVAFMALAGVFFAPLSSLVNSGQQFQLVGANLDRIRDVLEAEPEQEEAVGRGPAPRLSGEIRVRGLRFRYTGADADALRSVDLTVQPGQRVAIVGASGSGKSTLGKLLLALYLPTEGEISYDGHSLETLPWREVRGQFGVVLQESVLFSGSIHSNIALSNPALGRERVIEAAKLAAIHEDIMAMPMGYETLVSEGASALSGGQRQRLAIARAIAHGPTLLVLDEATSHLDVENEQRVAQNLRDLACTQVIMAHRLSTIRDADMIVVLDRGEIVERGTHEELIRADARYARLVRHQLERRDGANAVDGPPAPGVHPSAAPGHREFSTHVSAPSADREE